VLIIEIKMHFRWKLVFVLVVITSTLILSRVIKYASVEHGINIGSEDIRSLEVCPIHYFGSFK
jgi:hypothetical protein